MTKEIQLKGGDVALVDDDDYPLLSRFSWQRAGIAGYPATTIQTITGKNITIYMHRLIMGGFWQIDHINRNPIDNQKSNLRRATWQENGWNKGANKTRNGKPCSSKYKGVRYTPLKGKDRWFASIRHVEQGKPKDTGVTIRLGYFDSEIEAAKAYNKKIVELRGEWAWQNPIPEVG